MIRTLSPVLDLATLVAFVLIGRGTHDLHTATSWFFVVLWPLVAAWFAASLAFGVYGRETSWRRVWLAWGVGMAIALLLRASVTDRPTPLAFVLVLLVFTTITMVGRHLCELIVLRKLSIYMPHLIHHSGPRENADAGETYVSVTVRPAPAPLSGIMT